MLKIRNTPLDVEEYIQKMLKSPANVVFIGCVKKYSKGREVSYVEVDLNPSMRRKLEEKLREVGDVYLEIRVGVLKPGEPLSIVIGWGETREEAFRRCRDALESMKHHVKLTEYYT